MILNRSVLPLIVLTACLASAKDKDKKKQPENARDTIRVVAHIPLGGGTIDRFLETQHYQRDYLYAEHASEKGVTLIDVTHPDKPSVLSEADFPSHASDSIVSVAGNAALVSVSAGSRSSAANPQTFRILSFADPVHPTIKREFDGVTAMATDEKRGLIFLANGDGLWILRQQFAMDPEYVKEWEHMMLDNR